jgi:hypothetical protein
VPAGDFDLAQRCFESDGSYSNTNFDSAYGVHFSLDLLGNNPDRLLDAAEDVWRKEGFEISKDNQTPGVKHVFGSGRGFTLQATVNRNDGVGNVGGSSPCAPVPREMQDEILGPPSTNANESRELNG